MLACASEVSDCGRNLPASRSHRASLTGLTPQVLVSSGRQTRQEQNRPQFMIYQLIICGEILCLLWQSKLLCGQPRPFTLNVIPSNQKVKLRANSNRVRGKSFVQLPWASLWGQHHDPPRAWFVSLMSGTLSTPRACCTAGWKTWLWPVKRSTHRGGPSCPSRPPSTLGTQHKLWLAWGVTLSPLGHYLQPSR